MFFFVYEKVVCMFMVPNLITQAYLLGAIYLAYLISFPISISREVSFKQEYNIFLPY